MTTQSRDIVERLNDWAFCPIILHEGDHEQQSRLQNDLREAITTIKFLRKAAGAVTDGPSFADIAKDLPRRSTEPPEAA